MKISGKRLHYPITQTPEIARSFARDQKSLAAFYRGRRILVTGGMGFIGSNLAIALVERGARVTVVDAQVPGCGWHPSNLEPVSDRIECCPGDIADSAHMRPLVADQQVIFNLAGEISHINSMNNPARDLGINCEAQVRFLDLCRSENPGATIVYSSSRQVYGRPKYLPVDEAHPIHPVDYNGVHNYAAEHYHFLLRQQFQMPTICLRLGNTYGPRLGIHQDCRGFIDTFVRKALDGDQIVVYGDGRQLRGMTYVDDVVDAFLRAGQAGPSSSPVYNVGNPAPVSLWQIAETLCRIAGSPPPRLTPFPPERQVIDIGDYYPNPEKFCREFGWTPRVGLEEGLRKTVEFFRTGGHHRLHADPHSFS
ncbi:MAG: NAD-dependent epimerase/dehydratase family protein [Acidobacteria bacterium]|nr:NAD-dependent epimerase/dehydratase family protein [Acidobacteriota bacterium]